ncbi:MAG: type II toxin-antitoxin system HicA family toxin [Ktedonobacteraceae bacterium]
MSPKLPRITAIELLRALKRDGWQPARQSGSHMTMMHSTKKGCVIIPIHAVVTIKPKTLATILKQAGLTQKDLYKLL